MQIQKKRMLSRKKGKFLKITFAEIMLQLIWIFLLSRNCSNAHNNAIIAETCVDSSHKNYHKQGQQRKIFSLWCHVRKGTKHILHINPKPYLLWGVIKYVGVCPCSMMLPSICAASMIMTLKVRTQLCVLYHLI